MHPRCQLLSGHLATSRLALRCPSTRRALATTTTAPAAPTQPTASTPSPPVKNPLQRRKGGDLGAHLPKHVISADPYIPDYPYGDYALFKQANRGLYGEQMIQFGNNVSHKTKTKTRRDWKPNVLSKSLYSVALKKRIKLRVTSKVLKTMDREGGLDEYLLKDSIHRIKELGPMGWALRWTLMQKPEVVERLRADAAALGLDQATIDKQWPTPQMLSQQQSVDAFLARQSQLAALEPEAAEEPVEQQIFAPEADEPELTGKELTIANTIERQERKASALAASEYAKAVKAAERYLSRGLVDSIEEGLKVAFVRAPERHAARMELKKKFEDKVTAQFTLEDLQALRVRLNLPHIKDATAYKIAYNQWRRAEIEKMGGSYEAWRAAQSAATTEAREAAIEEAGSVEAINAARKAAWAAQLATAETASTNEALEPRERRRLERAIAKADLAIRARLSGGQEEYVELILEDARARRPAGELAALAWKAQKGGEERDAWGALVSESQKVSPAHA